MNSERPGSPESGALRWGWVSLLGQVPGGEVAGSFFLYPSLDAGAGFLRCGVGGDSEQGTEFLWRELLARCADWLQGVGVPPLGGGERSIPTEASDAFSTGEHERHVGALVQHELFPFVANDRPFYVQSAGDDHGGVVQGFFFEPIDRQKKTVPDVVGDDACQVEGGDLVVDAEELRKVGDDHAEQGVRSQRLNLVRVLVAKEHQRTNPPARGIVTVLQANERSEPLGADVKVANLRLYAAESSDVLGGQGLLVFLLVEPVEVRVVALIKEQPRIEGDLPTFGDPTHGIFHAPLQQGDIDPRCAKLYHHPLSSHEKVVQCDGIAHEVVVQKFLIFSFAALELIEVGRVVIHVFLQIHDHFARISSAVNFLVVGG